MEPIDTKVEVHCDLGAITVKVGSIFPLRRHGNESMTFIYDQSYISMPNAYALEPSLPLRAGSLHTSARQSIFGAFSDSSPDRWGRKIIERREAARARDAGVRPHSMSEIEILLCVRDDLRQGSLRFSLEGSNFLAHTKEGIPPLIQLPELLALARRIEDEEANYSQLQELFLAGGSLGGARPKAHVLYPDGSSAIAKFARPGVDEWDVMSWEKTLLDLAAKSGITVPDSKLISVGKEKMLLLKRFDRAGGMRVGYVSAMTMLEKKDGEQGSYLDIAEKIESFSLSTEVELKQLWRRIIFNVMTSNTDDHLRNHGFLKTKGDSWSLSPVFDLNPNPGANRFQATAIDYKDSTASLELCFSVIDYFRIKKPEALKIFSQVAKAINHWREVAHIHGISRNEISEMENAFSHKESQRFT